MSLVVEKRLGGYMRNGSFTLWLGIIGMQISEMIVMSDG